MKPSTLFIISSPFCTTKKLIVFGFLVALLPGCQQTGQREKKIAKIPISFKIDRFDRQFAESSPEDLPELKKNYPFLFPKKFDDTIWVNKMNDSVQLELNRAVHKKYPDLQQEKDGLEGLFQHLSYYFPEFKTPRVITMTTNVDYKNNIVVADSLLLIGLDNFLGEDHRFYKGIQRYFAKNFTEGQILPSIARKYAKQYVPRPHGRDFVDYMVYYGKLRYFEKRMLPHRSEGAIMGYTDDEIAWANSNERQIWGYIIEHGLLYKTDPEWRRRFFDPGPFTKFGLNLDRESPAQLGQYIGLRIVEDYAEKHDKIDLSTLLKMDDKTIYKQSNYKPKHD